MTQSMSEKAIRDELLKLGKYIYEVENYYPRLIITVDRLNYENDYIQLLIHLDPIEGGYVIKDFGSDAFNRIEFLVDCKDVVNQDSLKASVIALEKKYNLPCSFYIQDTIMGEYGYCVHSTIEKLNDRIIDLVNFIIEINQLTSILNMQLPMGD